ncbi:MAG: FAD:protein FMN transferase [Rhodobacteraceae bacterium]|nr:FAD:protein FMN transferase [Paracoccaceae bacterium]
MRPEFSRRRFLTISAAAAGFASTNAFAGDVQHWRGRALGANASMTLTGITPQHAQIIGQAVEQELTRLEQVFSLYRADSELSQLNRTGRLKQPSPEFLDVLSLSGALHAASDGAFDPTVQPLWVALMQGGNVQAARAAIGWGFVRFDTTEVRLMQPGMALTLNGIAQGYITDQIAALLRRRGLDQVLIDMGEIAAIGGRPDGQAWRAGIAMPDGQIVHHVALRDGALATSAPFGTVGPTNKELGHIIDPRENVASGPQTLVSISAATAAVADGLSTACCLLDQKAARAMVAKFPETNIEKLI